MYTMHMEETVFLEKSPKNLCGQYLQMAHGVTKFHACFSDVIIKFNAFLLKGYQ